MTESIILGIIGGSGIYNMPGATLLEDRQITTPFGRPSDNVKILQIAGAKVAFIPRHGAGHTLSPTEVPYRANIWAFKSLGVKHIISVSAVGSLQAHIPPGHCVVADQLIDQTRARLQERTFFSDGIVGHVSMADPYCDKLSKLLFDATNTAIADLGVGQTQKVHLGGALVVIEGPRFSTKAESKAFIKDGGSVIGMTACPEAFLAREAEISFSIICHVTDWDCWHPSHDNVTVEQVVAMFNKNCKLAQESVRNAVELVANQADKYQLDQSVAFTALGNLGAVMTKRELIPDAAKERLAPIIGKYL